jgi:hypothetical protein
MNTGKMLLATLAAWLLVVAFGPDTTPAKEGKVKSDAPAAGTLVVVDNAGKEHKFKKWKFLSGTERLSWLAPARKTGGEKTGKKGAPPRGLSGPEALVFREEASTDLRVGVLTYVLLDRIRAIDYHKKKQTVTVKVAKPGEDADAEEVLTGSTGFQGVNKLTIEVDTDLGELGVATEKYQGGTAKGVRSIRFPAPKPPAANKGRAAKVTLADKDKTVLAVTDLQPLYLLGRREMRRVPTLLFKRTVKIDLAKIGKLAFVESEERGSGLDYTVTLKSGKDHTLTLMNRTSPLDGKAATLLGFVGKVPAGYKFFPLRASPNNTFTKIEFEGDKEETKE